MTDRIRIRRTTTVGKVPTTLDLQEGELGLNTIDKKLYSSDGTSVFEIGNTIKSYSSLNTDITSLISGTTSGNLFEGITNGHFVIGIKSNDAQDGFHILDKGNATSSNTDPYLNRLFSVSRSLGVNTTLPISAVSFSGSGASLTSLNASNLSSGLVAPAILGTGSPTATTVLLGTGVWSSLTSSMITNALTYLPLPYRTYNSANTDITALINGSTFGNIVESINSGHFVVGILSNDINDGFHIIDKGDSLVSLTAPYANRLFSVQRNSVTIPMVTPSTNTSTGALIVDGGVGVSGAIFANSYNLIPVGRGAGGVNSNTAVGVHSLQANTTGINCSAFGFGSLRTNTTGTNCSAFGVNALQSNTTGSSCSAFGVGAGRYQSDGVTEISVTNNSCFFGTNTKGTQNATNENVIGFNATGNGSNTVTIGDNNIINTYLKGIVNTDLLISSKGIKIGGSFYPSYEANIDFLNDPANTWRRLVSVVCPSITFSTIGFCIEIIDPMGNHAMTNTVHTIKKETYYVACVRTESTTFDSPDACYVTGPSDRIRAVKTSIGNYEVQIQSDNTNREYRLSICVYASNGNHTVNYYAGDTASVGIAQYNASVSTTASENFQNVSIKSSTASTSTTTGALTVSGGVGVSGRVTAQELSATNLLYLDSKGTYNNIIEIGSTGGFSTTPAIDFHSGITPVDFDARIIATGGNGTTGKGSLNFTANNFTFSGLIYSSGIIRDPISTTGTLILTSGIGTAGTGAVIQLFGSTHGTYAGQSFLDTSIFNLRSLDGTVTYLTVNSSEVNILGRPLVLTAGTTTIQPLRLQTGVNLTTPVFGSVEFDGTNLYLTNNSVTPVRKTIAFTDSTIVGNASTATTLQVARNINGTAFNGSVDIITTTWGTIRNITIGSTGKSVDGSSNVAWTLAEIGAQAALGFTPVQQGGGTGQGTNKLYIGWRTDSTLGLQIDVTNFGSTWPINISGTATTLQTARTIALSGGATGTATSFNGGANITIPVTDLNASNLSSGTVPTVRLGSGTANTTTFLRGDNTWQTISTGYTTLAGLTDTTITTPANGNFLRHNGTSWVNIAASYWDQSNGGAYYNSSAQNLNNLVGGDNVLYVTTVQNSPSAAVSFGWVVTHNQYTSNTNDLIQISHPFRDAGHFAYRNKNSTGVWGSWKTLYSDIYHPDADKWTTARTLTIGSTGKSVDGSSNISWTLAEIGAAASTHTHTYLPLAGGTLTGHLGINNTLPTITLQDTDQNSAFIHVNSNQFYILRGDVNAATWTQVGGVWPLQIDLTNNNATFGGSVSATSFSGSGASLTSLNASNISTGTLSVNTLPTGTTSTTVALGNHTHAYLPLTGGTLTGNLSITGSLIGTGAGVGMYETSPLGTVAGNTQLLWSKTGLVSNVASERTWIRRRVAGTDWQTALFHNGITVDVSFGTPGVDTRAWWERDIQTGSQFWGNANTTFFSVDSSRFHIPLTTPSTSTTTGALIVSGGVGVAGSINAGAGITAGTNLTLANQGELRLSELTANGTNYVALRSPANVAANITLTLPATLGANGQVLVADASGNLSWTNNSADNLGNHTATTTLNMNGQSITNASSFYLSNNNFSITNNGSYTNISLGNTANSEYGVSSIEIPTHTTYGGTNTHHTGVKLASGGMSGWGTAQFQVYTSTNWKTYSAIPCFRVTNNIATVSSGILNGLSSTFGSSSIELGHNSTISFIDFHSNGTSAATDFEARIGCTGYTGGTGGGDLGIQSNNLTLTAAVTNINSDCRVSNNLSFQSVNGVGIRWFNDDRYKLYTSYSTDATFGGRLDTTSDWNMYFKVTLGTNRGFVFMNSTTPVAQIDGNGNLYVKGRSELGFGVAQGVPSTTTNILATAHTALGGFGGNYITIGQYTNATQWIQSSYIHPQTAIYHLALQPIGGNVGIGTASPGAKLTVSGGEGTYNAPNFGQTNLGAINILNTTSNRRNGITFSAAGVSNAQAGIYVHQDNGSGTTMYLATTDNYTIGPQTRLTILNNGNVGIGTGALIMNGSTVIDANGGWHRTYGATGWYNGTYEGGMYMIDTTWVRTYNGKSLYSQGNLGVAGAITVINGISPTNGAIRMTGNLHLNASSENGIYINWDSGGSVATSKMLVVGNGSSGEVMYVRRDGLTASNIFHTNKLEIAGDTLNRFELGKLVIRGHNPTLYFRDYDHASAMIHCNSNILYFLRGGVDTESWSGVYPLTLNLSDDAATFGGAVSIQGTVGIGGTINAPLYRTNGTTNGAVGIASSACVNTNAQMELTVPSYSNNTVHISFHKPGVFASNFGLDADNQFACGGWSSGNGYAGFKAGHITAFGNFVNNGGYVYPGRADASGAYQGNWFLGSHASYGLYTNTGFYASSHIFTAGAIQMINGITPLNGAIRLTPNLHLNSGGTTNAVIINWDSGGSVATDKMLRVGNGANSEIFYVRRDGLTSSNVFASNSSDTVSLPSHTWTGDTDTGMYHPAADQVGFAVGGSAAVLLTTTYQMNYGNLIIRPPDNIAADATTTTRDSSQLFLRGFYWNGTVSATHEWSISNDVTTVTPSSVLRIRAAGVDKMTIDSSGVLTAPALAGSNNRAVYSTPTGALTNATSDGRMKINITPVIYSLDTIKNLNPVTYNWKTDFEWTDPKTGETEVKNLQETLGSQKEIGLIAQEVEKLVPEAVGINSQGTYSLDYPKLVPVLIKGMQEQQEIIERQGGEISDLKTITQNQNDKIEKLEILLTSLLERVVRLES